MARARTAVYTPPPQVAAPAAAHHDYDAGGGRPWMVLTILVIVIVTLGYVLWSVYGQGAHDDAPVIAAQEGGFKQRYEGPPVAELATVEIDRVLAGDAPAPLAPRTKAKAPEQPLPVSALKAPPATAQIPVPPAASRAGAVGGFVVQIAALRSRGAADAAWDRLSARDPALFAGAQKDVQPADLGPKGQYFRVRAGYFAARDEAARFCERVKAMGQDCIVVAR
ncbi:MAG: SPOR domain-containing protein [Hyphomonadaceae bacterium]|nr:SPOR domain-containing protein [Hyphomonadaceae bacterium]